MRAKTILALGALFLTLSTNAQETQPLPDIPTPKSHFGFSIGDNYQLATYTQTEAYLKKIAAASDRARYTVIGKTEEGRDQLMLIISYPDTLKKMDNY